LGDDAGQLLGVRMRLRALRLRRLAVASGVLLLLLRPLRGTLDAVEPLAQLSLRLRDETDLGLDAADLRIALVVPALGGVHGVAGGEMRGAHRLDLGLDRTLLGQARLVLVRRLGRLRREPALLGIGLVATQQPQRVLLALALGLERTELARHL